MMRNSQRLFCETHVPGSFTSLRRPMLVAGLISVFGWADPTGAVQGRFTVPVVTGRPGEHAFIGHTGWVETYRAGYNEGRFSRIGPDGTFDLPESDKPVCLVAMFDRMETPLIVVPRWPIKPGNYDVPIPVEYACVPEGDRAGWDKQYAVAAKDYCQTITATGTQLYGLSLFDGPKVKKWGNKMHICILEGGPTSETLGLKNSPSPDPGYSGKVDRVTSGYSDRFMLRAGWRHGNVETEPGKTYTLRAESIYPHGGPRYELPAFVRPDKDDGYPGGEAFTDARPASGDLCCLIFGNSHGQLVENQLRWDDWEVFVPQHRPTTDWGQSFVSHGVSLAGICFWAGVGGDETVRCEVRIYEDGPWGKLLKPVKLARGHESSSAPIVIYPDCPAQKPEYERFNKLPSRLFQVGYLPDELKLEPGKTYYVELISDKPMLVYADGDSYPDGFAYYEGLKVDRQTVGKTVKHSGRWTLLMNISTYAKPGGERLDTGRR